MNDIKVLNYRLDFARSNEYLEVIMPFLEPMILNEQVEAIFDSFYFNE